MNIRSVIADEWRYIFKDKKVFAIIFLIPVLYTLLFGSVYSHHKVTEVATVIFDEDQSQLSRQIVQALDTSQSLQITQEVYSEADVQKSIDDGSARAGVIIPSGLEASVKGGTPSSVMTFIDGSNMMIANTVVKGANEVISTFSYGVSTKKLQMSGKQDEEITATFSTIPFSYRVMYNPTFDYSDFLVNGMVGVALQQVLFLGIGLTVAREKEQGRWEQFGQWKLNPWRIAIAKTFPYFVAGAFNTVCAAVLTTYIFGLSLRGSIWALLLLAVCFSFAVTGLGYLVSLMSKDRVSATQTAMLIALPSFVLSGYSWPFDAMPHALVIAGHMLPLTYYLDGVRNIFLKGYDMASIIQNCAALGLIGTGSLLASFLYTRFLGFAKTPMDSDVQLPAPAMQQSASNTVQM